MASEKKRKWADLSPKEQAEFQLHYVCSRDPIAAAKHVGISASSARRIIGSRDLDDLADIAEADARERIAEDAANWRVEAVAQVDELLDILREGAHQLTREARIPDVDKLVRLKAFLLGEPDSRQEVNVDGSSTVIAALGDNPEGVRLLSELAGRLASRPTQSGESAKQPE